VLEPLGPEHNDQDYDAWTSSVDHIHATPGWQDSKWPREMTPDENRQICSDTPTTSATARGSRTRCSIQGAAT
jgi:hypothetical protein